MKGILVGFFSFCFFFLSSAQVICLTPSQAPLIASAGRSISDIKIVRINYHFMLKSIGTENFTEINDNNGNNNFTGYDYARTITDWMNGWNSSNEQMRLPPGNNTPVISKNIRYVIDAVYFRRSDATSTLYSIDYGLNGQDKANVVNVFIVTGGGTTASGYAGLGDVLDPNSKNKFTSNQGIYGHYIAQVALYNAGSIPWINYHPEGCHLNHEIMHNFGLSHTVQLNNAPPCPTNCIGAFQNQLVSGTYTPGSPADPNCDDGCNDTPTAWDIAQYYNCQYHPACNGGPNDAWCSNNVMDYSLDNALSPCQIGIIHSSLENGMRTYLACDAVKSNLTLCDIGYPKLSYFGKDVSIGCTNTMATITGKEKIATYYSNFVELNNFEMDNTSEFEVYLLPICNF